MRSESDGRRVRIAALAFALAIAAALPGSAASPATAKFTALSPVPAPAIELKDNARAEAELVMREAHSQARTITREAVTERERLLAETRRVRALLSAALESVAEAEPEVAKPAKRPAQAA